MGVPKIIHYCWFGRSELPASAGRALRSWERHAPGFEIRRCDESVFDVSSCAWTKAAYAAHKYAFVADYARFQVLYEHGGVYMDLGSRLIKDISGLVDACAPFSAIEKMSLTANSGLVIAAEPGNALIEAVLRRYEETVFADSREFMLGHTVNEMLTSELEKLGFVREDRRQQVGEWTILPSSAFNPAYGFGGFHVKADTYSVHHYSGSWCEPRFQVKKKVMRVITPFVGQRAAEVIGRIVGEMRTQGLGTGLQNVTAVAARNLRRRFAGSTKGKGGTR